ncbi:hypothetical protein [Nocardia sp. NBC_00511]|uniref:hypothetical protein n=1 Tax=Nocardia sp. NBC_00511 TaxID=2903591 RepID=UPI0030DE0E25
MKLNGIRELLEAWDRGEGLGDLLGVSEQATPDEPPAAPTPPSAPGDLIDFDSFAPAPPLDPNRRELTDRLIDTGLSPTAAMEFVDRLSSDCDSLAARYADSLFDHLARKDQIRAEQDHTVRAADSAIARLISERAMSAMLDRAPRPADSPAPR